MRESERTGGGGGGEEVQRGCTWSYARERGMLHNLCRYILYVCRYIAKYISMANESNLKKWKKEVERDIVRRAGEGN